GAPLETDVAANTERPGVVTMETEAAVITETEAAAIPEAESWETVQKEASMTELLLTEPEKLR
ncbi:MAG: hypothetical protein Q4F03_04505, partial [Eubacteriales bacterium]|nr:hypothetical protein [Eubacteriales bacterium]